jgi:hypothetical protein
MFDHDARRKIVDQYKAEMSTASTNEERDEVRQADADRRAALLAAESGHQHAPGCKCGD